MIRNTYTSPLDPIYSRGPKVAFGARAVIDACKPYDWIKEFPRTAASSAELKKKVLDKWQKVFE